MTLQELYDIVGEAIEELGPEADVRFASQPRHPLEYSIADETATIAEDGPVLYLCEGDQLGYLSGEVCERLGW